MRPYQRKTLLVGDIQTHYLEAGEGPHLVLLHGGEYGASAETTWKFSIGPLAEKFHVVAPDMLGYGLTDKIYSFSDPSTSSVPANPIASGVRSGRSRR
jgi:pimeloyl-ACP methyl ester carboxylesterase